MAFALLKIRKLMKAVLQTPWTTTGYRL